VKRVSCKYLIIPFNLQIIVEDSDALDGDEPVNVAEDDPDIIIEDNPSTAHDDGPFSTIEDDSSSEYEDQPIGTSDDGLDSSYEEGVEEADVAHSEDNEDDIEAEEAELTPEVQIQRELQESRDAGNDLPLQLGLHLLNSFQCSSHGETANRHQDIQGLDSHWSLDDLTEDMRQIPYILNSPTILPYNSAHRGCSYEWAKLFEGRPETKSNSDGDGNNDSQEEPERTGNKPKVCLACTEQPSDARVSQFDIDSTIGFAQSLAFARHGLCLNFAPQFHQNIQSNVHLSMQVIDHSGGRARAKRIPLFKIPHITLGRVVGIEGMSVYAFFPKQWNIEKQTNFPGKLNGNEHGILEQWTNAILLPSLASCLSSDIGQHLPPSLLLAQLRAKARYHENQARANREDFAHQSLHYLIQGHSLAAIWDEIMRRSQLQDNSIFANLQLVFSCKGTKLLYKSDTIEGAWDLYHKSTQHALNYEYLDPDQVWIDIGKETVCKTWQAISEDDPSNNGANSTSPGIFLWRRCCTEHLASWLLFEQKPSSARITKFTPAMLGDSLEVTLEYSHTSIQRSNGLVYSQAYNSVKEIFDATKLKPFKGSYLDKLTWDPDVRSVLQKRGKAVLATTKQLRSSYLSSKRRIDEGLRSGGGLSYGVREEHRISMRFFERMRSALTEHQEQGQDQINTGPYPYWELSSRTYLDYLAYNTNKFVFAFEWVLGQQKSNGISYGHSMVLQMFLRALQCSFDSVNADLTPSLWRSLYTVKHLQAQRLGIGLQESVLQCGYGWLFADRIDWERLKFCVDIADQIGFQDITLHDSYRRQWRGVKDAKDDFKKLEIIGRWLELYASNEGLCSEILSFMIGFLHRAFRKDFFHSIKDLLVPERARKALDGKVMLCWDSIIEVVHVEEPESGGTRIKGMDLRHPDRTKIRTLQQLINLLWDSGGSDRGRWEKYSYRVLYEQARRLVRQHVSKSCEASFHEFNKRQFVLTNWILPFPNTQRFWRGTAGCKEFVAVQHRRLARAQIVKRLRWAQLQRMHERYSKQFSRNAWMGGWNLASRRRGTIEMGPLRGVPCEDEGIARWLDGDWKEFEERIIEDFEAE
jgi:hypothetical protein